MFKIPRLLLGTCLTVVTALLMHDQSTAQCDATESQKITASDGAAGDEYGNSVSLDGSLALVGAPSADLGPFGSGGALRSDAGAVYAYRYDGNSWVEIQKLSVADARHADYFGTSVVVDGDLAMIGATGRDDAGTNSGMVHVWRYDGTQWEEVQRLSASDARAGDALGWSVSVHGNVAVVGALGDDDFAPAAGSAYIFRYDGSQWIEEQEVHAGDGAAADQFGFAVSAGEGVILIGAPQHNARWYQEGAAYVYRYDGSAWMEEQQLLASDRAAADFLGYAVSLDGNLALVAAPNDLLSGSAYLFRFDGADWLEEHKLFPSDGEYGDSFGASVALRGDDLLIGASTHDHVGLDAGSAYVFEDNGLLLEKQELFASDAGSYDKLGRSVSLSGSTALVGSCCGSAYFFSLADLGLDASPETADAGDTLTFTTCGGIPSALDLLAVVDINDFHTFRSIALGSFDSLGRSKLSGLVPPGLSGIQVTFQCFGFYHPDRIGTSNPAIVDFW